LLRDITEEMISPRFLRFLEKVTGIDALLADPHLIGGGLHLSGPGGVLMPHTDFHTLREFWLFRRLNVILYLNEDWQEDWGGSLKLYRKGKKEADRAIVPIFGRMVIFCTDARSVHGFPGPIADGHWRRSIALYYYTAKDTAIWGGDNTTYWQEHGEAQTASQVARLFAFRAIRKASEILSRTAHRFNPHAGV
jgi:Rps23 Pro-64 3,4-dihydroxylase Tpa1-like proline 4-hydroxylase